MIDLVFHDGNCWVIVDYRSDVTGSRLTDLVNAYRPQVMCYKRYWEQITGEPARAALYFVDNGHVAWL